MFRWINIFSFQVVFTEDNTNDERSVTIEISLKTICSEVMSLALRKLQKNDPVNSYSLYHMRNDRSGKKPQTLETKINKGRENMVCVCGVMKVVCAHCADTTSIEGCSK